LGSNKKNTIRIGVSLVVGVLLLVALIWWTGIDEIGAAIGSASPLWLAVSAAFVLPIYLLRAIRWKFLLIPVKKTVRVSTTFWSTAVGNMVNTIIPIRLGEFVKAYILGEKEETGFAPGLSSIVVERTLDMIGLLSIGIVTMFLVSAQASLSDLVGNIFIAVGVLIAVILAVIIAGIKKEDLIIKVITRTTSKIPLVKKYTTRIADFTSSLIQGLKGLSQNPKMFMDSMVFPNSLNLPDIHSVRLPHAFYRSNPGWNPHVTLTHPTRHTRLRRNLRNLLGTNLLRLRRTRKPTTSHGVNKPPSRTATSHNHRRHKRSLDGHVLRRNLLTQKIRRKQETTHKPKRGKKSINPQKEVVVSMKKIVTTTSRIPFRRNFDY
jgi:hypothetical protein